ncbi:sulfotransferase [Alloalcanivorax mobilis]|uniref:sulfotransferase n=1 Tax=Alloalcanivorax mobilis TaxID=2019569 RepID=UPI000C756331|nr:sulfotransferase [Alloalcanivorax mobilis]
MSFIRAVGSGIISNLGDVRNRQQAKNKQKFFCIGRNKTGTTSLEKAFRDLRFVVGDQRRGELLADKYYFKGDFDPIIRFCKTAQVFQDVPFSYPETYKYLDAAFPGSKFILTIRDSPEVWYQSLTKFHTKRFGKNGKLPIGDDLLAAPYVRRGFVYNTVRLHGTPDDDPYNKEIMIDHYIKHNQAVADYFIDRPDSLLVINVSKSDAYKKFIDFIGAESESRDFPWENKT